MLHPSYTDLMKVVNKDVEEGDTKVVNSRYSIVMATSKRARQLIAGDLPLVDAKEGDKPLSIAIDELNQGKLKILAENCRRRGIGSDRADAQVVSAFFVTATSQSPGSPRDLGDRLQSRNVPFGTSGDCECECENYDRRLRYEDIVYLSRVR